MTREELKTEVIKWTPALLGMGKECTDKTLEAQKAIVDMLEHQPQGDLISREEVNNIIEKFFEEAQPYSLSWKWKNELKAKVNELSPVEPQDWISVKKHGNPKEDDDYWVTFVKEDYDTHDKWIEVDIDSFCVKTQKWSHHNNADDKVTAWMPLPSSYKGDAE